MEERIKRRWLSSWEGCSCQIQQTAAADEAAASHKHSHPAIQETNNIIKKCHKTGEQVNTHLSLPIICIMVDFHFFQKLPPELRQEIWQYAIEPRMVKVPLRRKPRGQPRSRRRRRRRPFRPENSIFSPPFLAPLPTLFQVCRESRALLSRDYQKAFFNGCRKTATPAYTWVNYCIDTITAHRKLVPILATGAKRALIQCLQVTACDGIVFTSPFNAPMSTISYLFEFPNLRSATLLLRDAHHRYASDASWPACVYMFMWECYATCSPAPVDAKFLRLKYGQRQELNRHNWFLSGGEPSLGGTGKTISMPISDMLAHFSHKKGLLWRHTDCDCTGAIALPLEWHIRTTPSWEGGTQLSEFKGISVYNPRI